MTPKSAVNIRKQAEFVIQNRECHGALHPVLQGIQARRHMLAHVPRKTITLYGLTGRQDRVPACPSSERPTQESC